MVDFIFDEERLSDHGFMICSFGSSDTQTVPVSAETYNTVRAPLQYKDKKTSINIGENLTTTLSICKIDCYGEDSFLSADDVSEITRWLCRHDYKKFQKIESPDEFYQFDEVYYEVQISVSKIVWCDHVLGLELTITNDSPYAYQDIQINLDNTNQLIVSNYSDEEGYTYPQCTIKVLSSGDFRLSNSLTNDTMVINNCSENEVITINPYSMQITSSDNNHDLSSDFNYVFPRIFTEYHKYTNIFSMSCNCNIEFKYQRLRKVGL